jgi:CheY-like chemotaxis protein
MGAGDGVAGQAVTGWEPSAHSAHSARSGTTEPIGLLLVEDNPGDVELTREALRESVLHTRLTVVRDGVDALALLRRQGVYRDAPRPDLILLDLNLPKKNGRAVLAEIKGDPSLRRIPVIVLTSSLAEEDIQSAYDLHANCYVPKPVGFDEFNAAVRSIEQFWFSVARLSCD